MGATKTQIFTAKQNKLAAILKAMAHPARIAIIQHLVKRDHCICSCFVEELGLAQATVSQHLKELKDVGIIKGCVEGNSICYCLEPTVWLQVRKEFDALFKS